MLKVSIKKKLASTKLRSEIREDLSHTKVKVLSMLMKLSDVKLVRLVRSKGRSERRWLVKNQDLKFVLKSIEECVIVSPVLL